MAKILRLDVIAEGVETQAQLNYLYECGCEMVQGFYFSPPVNYADLTQLLQHEVNTHYETFDFIV